MSRSILMLDFDHTIAKVDTLAHFITWNNTPKSVIDEINEIKKQVVNGNINISDSVTAIILKSKADIKSLNMFGKYIVSHCIDDDTIQMIDEFKKYKNLDVVIVSNGIYDLLKPSADNFGLKLYCSELQYDNNNICHNIINNGFNLSKYEGIFRNINLQSYDISIMVGDAYNDYLVYLNKACTDYICYTRYNEWDFSKDISTKKANSIASLSEQLRVILASYI